MSDWWQRGYPGGPMVKTPGFPRPLYPPDASRYGKRPSTNGPDVEAYKRTVSRAGRWPWQPFDEAYSNAFAHGKAGGDVGDSGVAGVQRQGSPKLDDTGWLGEKTFNLLRSIRIPDPLPHAGEMAMDATAVNMIAEAWDLFGGHEPDTPTSGSIRQAALRRAISQIGVVESGDNLNPYGAWYGANGQPWCAMFVTWSYELGAQDIGKDSLAFVRGSRYAYVPYLLGDSNANRYGLAPTLDPIPGDCVCFNWDGGEFDHVGIFEGWLSGDGFSTVEGNTSTASDANGGQVMRRTRYVSGQGTQFVRVGE
jgi:CHAP domain-containing protein